MNVDAFDFELPESAIALRPAVPRDSARLLHVGSGAKFSNHTVSDLPTLLRAGDVLVLNDTRVLRAALAAIRPARAHGGGGDVEITLNLHKQVSGNIWRAFARPAKRLKPGDRLDISDGFYTEVIEKDAGGDVALRFNMSGEALSAAIETAGAPPLPPYIARKRVADARDVQDSQTIYAQDAGSVAAPTAGLHFDEAILAALKEKGVNLAFVTLHVGAGTFQPVRVDNIQEHKMHAEFAEVPQDVVDAVLETKANGKRVIAVGTTSVRSLESAAKACVDRKHKDVIAPFNEDTEIFIYPGFEFKVVDAMFTNFHLPESTLMMLISAFAGKDNVMNAYQEAIEKEYRFFSYGDSMFIERA